MAQTARKKLINVPVNSSGEDIFPGPSVTGVTRPNKENNASELEEPHFYDAPNVVTVKKTFVFKNEPTESKATGRMIQYQNITPPLHRYPPPFNTSEVPQHITTNVSLTHQAVSPPHQRSKGLPVPPTKPKGLTSAKAWMEPLQGTGTGLETAAKGASLLSRQPANHKQKMSAHSAMPLNRSCANGGGRQRGGDGGSRVPVTNRNGPPIRDTATLPG